MINDLAICFDGHREFDWTGKWRIAHRSRIDDCNFAFIPPHFFSFFFTLHALRSGRIERDLMRSRTGRHYEIHLLSLPGGKANERKWIPIPRSLIAHWPLCNLKRTRVPRLPRPFLPPPLLRKPPSRPPFPHYKFNNIGHDYIKFS